MAGIPPSLGLDRARIEGEGEGERDGRKMEEIGREGISRQADRQLGR